MPQEEFYALLKAATDESSYDLVWLESRFLAETVSPAIAKHRLCNSGDLLQKLGLGKTMEEIRKKIDRDRSLPLYHQGVLVGCFQRHHDEDESLQALVLMENLMTKASAYLALRNLLDLRELRGVGDRFHPQLFGRGGRRPVPAGRRQSGPRHRRNGRVPQRHFL